MVANPEPLHPLCNRNAKRAIAQADAHTAIFSVTDGFELQRWMRQVFFEQNKIFARELLHFLRQRLNALPEAR